MEGCCVRDKINDILTHYCDDQEDKSQQCRGEQNYPNMTVYKI